MTRKTSLGLVGLRALVAGLLTAMIVSSAHAVINPRFTPVDLVRTSKQIVALRVSVPKGKLVLGEVMATLKGDAPSEKQLEFEIDASRDLVPAEVADAFVASKTATAVLVLQGGGDESSNDAPAGAMQIGIRWFAVFRERGKWRLGQDRQDLFAVWAGSAEKLVEGTRYVLADPAASFPVRSDITWERDLHLGKLPGQATACLVADFGEPIGLCVLVLSDGGDRVYQAAAKGFEPADVTSKLRLRTASKLVAPGDFNGDGRIDLACWDGELVRVATQTAEGTFTVQKSGVKLTDCLSLDTLNVDEPARTGLLAGTADGPVLLIPGDDGAFTTRAIAAPVKRSAFSDFGPGGFCAVADFNADGHCDIVELFAGGTVFHAGDAPGRFKTPVNNPVDVVTNPSSAVCGDYDADGRLDLIVGGENGIALLSGGKSRIFSNLIGDTGELAYHGNMNRPKVIGCVPCDVNNDGRQSVALFGPNRCPMLFFNRGFACFGWARELDLAGTGGAQVEFANPLDPFADPSVAKARLKAAEVLQYGQTAATILDLNSDGVQDMLAVDLKGEVWALFGSREVGRALGATISLTPNSPEPITVTVRAKGRCQGMHVIRPGVPAFVGRAQPGPLDLEWKGLDGKVEDRRVIVIKPTRVKIGD